MKSAHRLVADSNNAHGDHFEINGTYDVIMRHFWPEQGHFIDSYLFNKIFWRYEAIL